MSDELLVDVTDAVATLTINRPESRNAISLGMYRELPDVVTSVDADPTVKVLVVRGAGDRAFAAGADISEFREVRGDAESARSYNQHVAAAERALEGMRKPTIAMVHGHCVGGGCGLALACDLRYCDDRARFAITPAKLGLVYGLESTKRLVDLVGPAQAKWMLFSGERVDAERAARRGLVDGVFPAEELSETTHAFARTIAERAQFSVTAAKEMVRRVTAGQVHDDDETRRLRSSSFDTDDYAEGVRAFLEKRSPRFG